MDDITSALLGELSRIRRRFEAIEALAPNCELKTERRRILSRFQVRRTVPVHATMPAMDLPAGYSETFIPGNGCEVPPERISSFDELESAIVLYRVNGEPCVTANAEPMYKTAGWEVSHLVSIRGRDCDAVTKVFKAINHWCFINHNLLRSIGLLPPVAVIDAYSMLWPDIVLALAEQSTKKPRWLISVNANMKIELSAWKNKIHRRQLKEFADSPWGVTDELMAMIGDEPEDLHTTLDDFIAESVTAIDSLLKLVERSAIAEEQTPSQESKFEDGLCESSRVLTWGGVRYVLTPNQMCVVRVLHEAYVKHKPEVGLAELKNKCDCAALDESFAKVFQVKRQGKKSYSEVLDVIDSKTTQGIYFLKDPKKA